MPSDAELIGAWLREARKAHGRFSAEQSAVQVGTTGRTMGTWERGEVAPPADMLLALARLYGADIGELLRPRGWKGEGGHPLPRVPMRPVSPPGADADRAASKVSRGKR